jgi:hypothetical protein
MEHLTNNNIVDKGNDFCPYLSGCPFFNELALSFVAKTLKNIYCKGSYKECKRFILKSSGGEAHPRMWPNGSTPKA